MPEKGKQSSEDQKREDGQLQIRLCTKYAVPDAVFNLPTSIDPSGLASLVRGLLPASSPPDFDWLCHSELLRGKLGEQVALRPEITPESVITVKFIEKSEPPNHKCLSIMMIGCLNSSL